MTHEQMKARQDNWKYRRLIIFGTVGTILAMLGYLAAYGSGDNAVQNTLAQTLPFAMVGIITMYIGGPIADDWLQFRKSA